jgi:hypothetical protein
MDENKTESFRPRHVDKSMELGSQRLRIVWIVDAMTFGRLQV